MARYIDADALKTRIKEYAADVYAVDLDDSSTFAGNSKSQNYAEGLYEAIELIDDAHSADVAPVVHERWIATNCGTWCPHCFVEALYSENGDTALSPYCPNCGARMDERTEPAGGTDGNGTEGMQWKIRKLKQPGKIHRLVIDGRLPDLNQYTDTQRTNRFAGAKMKAKAQEYISAFIWQQLRGVHVDRPVRVRYTWIEPNQRKDLDNVAFAKKFIQDALVSCGVLQGDGWKYITAFSDTFMIDKDRPRIVVYICEEGEHEAAGKPKPKKGTGDNIMLDMPARSRK